MFRRSASLILVLLVVICFILQCKVPLDPVDPSYTRVELLLRNSLWLQSNSSITDTVDKPIQIGLALNLPPYLDSIKFSVKAEGKVLFDTIFKSFSSGYKDTIWKSMSFSEPGYKLVSVVPFSDEVTLMPVSADITIVKKTSTIQPDNHPPKWSETTVNVALNDTARYELNLSSLCSDPDKEVLRFAISGKTLSGDTIIDSLYKFKASSATIGKNSVELIASDPSGLKDTMELVLNVTALGTDANPPEVTIITPDRDSSVTNSENYVVDLLCSDASGIDSVYAIFNSKTTLAVLENGHYKITMTGLVAGVYNAIQITVRDKSLNALKTTKTIKIKYVQSFTIAYNGNGNSSGAIPIDTVKYETGTTATIKGNTGNLVRTGYVFAGWNTAADGSGAAYAVGSTFTMGTGNVILFARWTQNPTFTVTYDGNTSATGTAPSDSGKYETGSPATVKDNIGNLAKTGFTFAGWNTTADGSGTAYAAGSTYTMGTANVKLFARWTQNATFTVTYDANTGSGTVPSDINKYETGTMVTVQSSSALVKTGHTFNGWNTATDGSGTAYAAAAAFKMLSANVTLYAQWKIKTYTLKYDGNGNMGGDVPGDALYDSNTTVTVSANINSLTKTGFDFNGWNTSANGSGVAYAAASTFRIKSDTTLYAQWTVKKYKLTIVPPVNGTVNLSGEVSVDSSAATTITATAADGFKFKYWRVTAGSAKITDTASASTTVVLTQGNASIKAVFGCLTFNKTISFTEYTSVGNPSIAQDSDGNYYVAFNCRKTGSATIAAVMKLDLNGNIVWKQEYTDGSYNVPVGSIRKTSDGCFLLAGTSMYSREKSGMHLWKIASNKNQIFSWDVGDGAISGNFAFETSDGGFVIGGQGGGGTAYKTTSNGYEISWKNSYDGAAMFLDGQETADGGCIFVGDNTRLIVIKTDSRGASTWQQSTLDYCANGDGSVSIHQTTDGGYIIGCESGSYYTTNRYCGLIKLSASGSIEWQKTNSLGTGIKTVRQTADNGYVYLGTTEVLGAGGIDLYLVKTNSTGEITWGKTFGTDGSDIVGILEMCNDGGFIITGTSGDNTSNHNKIMIVKTDENGNVE
jgi:uncharacterized repeat protein (TIGR02543 family)